MKTYIILKNIGLGLLGFALITILIAGFSKLNPELNDNFVWYFTQYSWYFYVLFKGYQELESIKK